MTLANSPPAPPQLLRVLGLVFGLSVVVGRMIGSGIMRAPGVVALGIRSEPLILLAWLVGGVVTMLAAMPVVEAGASVPRAGGAYAIAARAFGPLTGLFTGWIAALSPSAGNAVIAVVFGEYVHRLGLAGGLPTSVIACALILTMGAINWMGTRVCGASQSIGSAAKGAAFLVLAAVLFASPRAAAPPPSEAPALVGGAAIGAVVMAIRVIFQTYGGWETAINYSEEVRRPGRDLARAVFWGIGAVVVLYVLVNAAVLHVLNPADIAGSALAVGDAAKASLGAAGDKTITGIGLLSLAAAVNLGVMGPSRLIWRMAADRVLPPWLAVVAKSGAPRRSVTLVVIVSLLFAATGTYESIVRIYVPWGIGGILMVCLSAIKLRVAEPDLRRPWKMPLFPWVAIGAALVQAGLIAVIVADDPKGGLLSALVAVAPLPIYLLFARTWRRQAGKA